VLIDLIGFGIALPVLGIYAVDHFKATGVMVAVLGSSYSAAQAVAAPILGKLSDRYGRKPILFCALVGTAIAALFTGLATSLWLLVVWRFIDGLTGGTYGVAAAAVSDLAPPQRRATLMGMLGAAFGIGFTVGPAIGALATIVYGPRAPFFLLAMLAAANAVAMLVRVPETRGLARAEGASYDGTGQRDALATSWRHNGLPILFAAGFLTTFAFSAFETHFSTFGRLDLGLTQRNAGFALAIVGIVSSLVQGGLIGPVTKRFGNAPLALWGTLTTAAGLTLFGAASGWLLLVPSMFVLAAGQGFASPALRAITANRIDPDHRGSVLGVEQSSGAIASVVGPLAGGLAFDHIAHASPFLFGAALFVIAAVILSRVINTPSQKATP
jgi:MFS transporter, DHA1 family, tetracycline resistance protein